ncbi:hypothetical protein [Streptomyces adustus]|uniref:hypothetical protein n=1 Tax=Streptomyces adustus TaxID=1609272 RepID=UPI003722D49C
MSAVATADRPLPLAYESGTVLVRHRAYGPGQQPAPTGPPTMKPRPRSRSDNTAPDQPDAPAVIPAESCPHTPARSARRPQATALF